MTKMISFMFKNIFFIVHDLTIFYENFMILAYQENELIMYKVNFYLFLI